MGEVYLACSGCCFGSWFIGGCYKFVRTRKENTTANQCVVASIIRLTVFHVEVQSFVRLFVASTVIVRRGLLLLGHAVMYIGSLCRSPEDVMLHAAIVEHRQFTGHNGTLDVAECNTCPFVGPPL